MVTRVNLVIVYRTAKDAYVTKKNENIKRRKQNRSSAKPHWKKLSKNHHSNNHNHNHHKNIWGLYLNIEGEFVF